MWIRTEDKLIEAVVFVVARNFLSRKKYALTAMSSAGGMSAESHCIAFFSDKEQANAELDRIVAAIVANDSLYTIPEKYYRY